MREPKSSTVSGLIPDGHANRKENTVTTVNKGVAAQFRGSS